MLIVATKISSEAIPESNNLTDHPILLIFTRVGEAPVFLSF